MGVGQDVITSNPQGAYIFTTQNPKTGQDIVAVDVSNLNSGHYLNTLMLDRVYLLLVKMIETLQNVAVAQANQLKFLTQWQRAYTNKMEQVHVFTAKDKFAPGDISGTGTDEGTIRQDLNQLGSTFTEKMRAQNSIVSDSAKALQTAISQTQDAINQQSNMATSIIQQFNSILSSIYR